MLEHEARKPTAMSATLARFWVYFKSYWHPVMDGLETLEAIRTSPAHAALPIVVLTSEKTDGLVRRLVELGITDYLSKPFGKDRLAGRLARIIGRLRDPAILRQPGPTGSDRRVLVVEQDPDRRQFLLAALASHAAVVAADSAAVALRLCMDMPDPGVGIVLVGEQIGLPPVESFIPRLRHLPAASGARVIGFRPQRGTEPGGSPDPFDEVIEWAYVPEVFLARFEQAVTGAEAPPAGLAALRFEPRARCDSVPPSSCSGSCCLRR